VRDLRDRALIATLAYSFARITAALRMKVEDLRPQGAGWRVRPHEKGGKQHAMAFHHALAEAPRAYIDAAGPEGPHHPSESPCRRAPFILRAQQVNYCLFVTAQVGF
jgi:integrase